MATITARSENTDRRVVNKPPGSDQCANPLSRTGREFALPPARRENRTREWGLPADDLTECYVDLVRSAMDIPG